MNSSVGNACGSCDKKGPDLLKCSVCKSAWYCNVQCQKKDWKRHKQCCRKFGTEAQKGPETGEGQSSGEKDCRVVKVYPEGVLTDLPDMTLTNFDHITGKVTKHRTLHRDTGDGIGNFVATEMDMIVKIQTSVDFTIRPKLWVYNESRDYYVIIKGHDRYYDAINDKVLLEGLPCVRKDPRLRKLYVKAHLNSDSSLDIYLDCTYNIKKW